MLCKMPSAIAMLTSDAPPCVTNGNGIPVIGMIPITIPTFTKSWKRTIDATPAEIADADHPDLPRIRFRFDRYHHARLRQLIDALNRDG